MHEFLDTAALQRVSEEIHAPSARQERLVRLVPSRAARPVAPAATGVELRHLRNFVGVVQAGQITRAAKALRVAQPAVSRSIAQLEHAIGVRLLHRHAHGVSVTEAGEAFARDAIEVLAQVDRALAVGHRHARRLVVGFHSLTLATAAGGYFASARERNPDIELHWRELHSPGREEPLLAWDVDAAVMWNPVAAPGTRQRELHRQTRVALLAAAHPLAVRDALSVNDVLHQIFVASDASIDPRWAGFWRLDEERGARARTSAVTARTTEEAVAIVASGAAITTMPSSLAAAYTHPGVVAIPVLDAPAAVVELVWSVTAHNALLDAVLDALEGDACEG